MLLGRDWATSVIDVCYDQPVRSPAERTAMGRIGQIKG